jgi:antitoxin HicB
MTTYPVTVQDDDNDTILVLFPDFPEAATFGDTKEEALARAVDALETVIDAYIADRRQIPAPSAITADSVVVPALVDTKVQLYRAMLEQRVSKTELARRMQVHPPQIDRLLNIKHGSTVGQLETAASALGLCLQITLSRQAGPVSSKDRVLKATVPAVHRYPPRRPAAQRPVAKRSRAHPGVIDAERTGHRASAAQKKR